MANGTRTVVVVLALVVGLAVGWLIGQKRPSPESQPTPTPVATVPAPAPSPTVHHPFVTPGPPYPAAKNWNVLVGPNNPCTVTEDGKPVDVLTISKRGRQSITFQSTGTEMLGILLHVPAGSPQPFKKVAYAGPDPTDGSDVWALECDSPRQKCVTGPAESNAPYYVKVYQILDRKTPCDAGIIIEQ